MTEDRTDKEEANDDDEVWDDEPDDNEKEYLWGDTSVIFADEELIDGTNEFVNKARTGKLLLILH